MRGLARLAGACLIPAVVGGCADLRVQVDVLNPDYVRTTVPRMSSDLKRAAALDAGDGSIRRVEGEIYSNGLVRLAEACDEASAGVIDRLLRLPLAPQQKQALEAAKSRVRPSNAQAEQRARSIRQQVSTRFEKFDREAQIQLKQAGFSGTVTPTVAQILQQHRANYQSVLNDIQCQDPNQLFPSLTNEHRDEIRAAIDEEIRQVSGSVQATVIESRVMAERQITGSKGVALVRRPEAYYVRSAPEAMWETRFNHAQGRGIFGGTDIVIKMNDTGEFTVKGFVFDASKTANMVSKVGVRSLAILASGLGPAPTYSPRPGETLAFSRASDVQEAKNALAVADERRRTHAVALRVISSAVLANSAQLSAGSEAAHQEVMNVFEAWKDAWKEKEGTMDPVEP